MAKIINGVMHLWRGDSENFDVGFTVDGTAYSFAVGDKITFTVRETPSSDTVILTATDTVTSATAGAKFTLKIDKTVMAAAAVGLFSGDVQVDFSDGTRKTLWPKQDGSAIYYNASKNWKNVAIDAEVTQ